MPLLARRQQVCPYAGGTLALRCSDIASFRLSNRRSKAPVSDQLRSLRREWRDALQQEREERREERVALGDALQQEREEREALGDTVQQTRARLEPLEATYIRNILHQVAKSVLCRPSRQESKAVTETKTYVDYANASALKKLASFLHRPDGEVRQELHNLALQRNLDAHPPDLEALDLWVKDAQQMCGLRSNLYDCNAFACSLLEQYPKIRPLLGTWVGMGARGGLPVRGLRREIRLARQLTACNTCLVAEP